MKESIIIKCPDCSENFIKQEIEEKPQVILCKCENIKIELVEKEKLLFLVHYKNNEPTIKMKNK